MAPYSFSAREEWELNWHKRAREERDSPSQMTRIMREELLSVLNLKYQCCPGQLTRISGMRSLSLFGSSLSVSNLLEKCFSFYISNEPSIFCRVSCLYGRSHTVSAKCSWLVNFIERWINYTFVTREQLSLNFDRSWLSKGHSYFSVYLSVTSSFWSKFHLCWQCATSKTSVV